MTTARPILFSAPMIRALLDGSKTQTRRVVHARHLPAVTNLTAMFLAGDWDKRPMPYGAPGDLLWVRETWCINGFPSTATSPEHCYFAASDEVQAAHDGDGFTIFNKDGSERSPWKPSIHMPRWASRLTLELTDVRIEPLVGHRLSPIV